MEKSVCNSIIDEDTAPLNCCSNGGGGVLLEVTSFHHLRYWENVAGPLNYRKTTTDRFFWLTIS